jgi:hypothetical protein
MGPTGYALLGALLGAALGITGNWVAKPKWTDEHPGRVVLLVIGLAVVSGLVAAAAGALADRETVTAAPPDPQATKAPGPTATPDPDRPTTTRPTTTTTKEPAPPTTSRLPRSAVPDQLVGSWGGGSEGATADRSYTFNSSGAVLYRRGSADIEGTVVVSGKTLTLYFPGSEPQRYRWSIESYEVSGYSFSNLSLDGFTYVRQDAP